MGLHDLIERHTLTGNEDAEALAILIFEDLMNDVDLLQEILLPALRHRIVIYMRAAAREAERDSILDGKPTANPTADRLAFLNERFYVPGVGFVTWAEATVAHHELRIGYLTDKVQGILDTAALHEKAIKQIQEAGVKTLGEVHKRPRRTRTANKAS